MNINVETIFKGIKHSKLPTVNNELHFYFCTVPKEGKNIDFRLCHIIQLLLTIIPKVIKIYQIILL